MVLSIRVRAEEACRPQPQLLWDTVWVQDPVTTLTAQGGFGDWQVGAGDEVGNVGGLQSKAALHTATLIQLMTDHRAPDDLEIEGTDPRGWWGDSIKFPDEPVERGLGCNLWELERGRLDDVEIPLRAQEMVEQAMAVFVDQGVVARTEVEVEANPIEGQLLIGVRHFSRDGAAVYDQKFAALWGQHVIYPLAQTLAQTLKR